MAVAVFFVSHWLSSVFFQSFFLHRYGAHRMFSMSRGWERFFHLCTYVTQGASYLDPRGYAILHREHHAFSDTPRDPHSPHQHPDVFRMMWHTKGRYDVYAHHLAEPEARFSAGGFPTWPALERVGQGYLARVLWGLGYVGFYVVFATAWWQFLLLPIHFLMGPVHGAIVNWCGHRYGYRNHVTTDKSRNTLPIEALTMGELFQNNHHKHPQRPNFATSWFEVDPTYQIMRVLAALRIIDMRSKVERLHTGEPVREAA
ncbi:MAG: acyl-CoA desaturase [Deltaproteobacteria bacterium]|nr:acyl-CoA desaturase [Nannocystaceae bacterium]